MNIIQLLGGFLFLALLAGVLVVFLLSLSALLVVARVKKSWKLAIWSIVGTTTIAGLLAGFLVYGYTLVFGPYDPSTPVELAQAYEADFSSPRRASRC